MRERERWGGGKCTSIFGYPECRAHTQNYSTQLEILAWNQQKRGRAKWFQEHKLSALYKRLRRRRRRRGPRWRRRQINGAPKWFLPVQLLQLFVVLVWHQALLLLLQRALERSKAHQLLRTEFMAAAAAALTTKSFLGHFEQLKPKLGAFNWEL